MARLFAVETPLPGAKPELKRLAESLVADDRPGDWAQALMDLGAMICAPSSPACAVCPLADACLARATGAPERFPLRDAKPDRPHRHGVAYLLTSGEAVARPTDLRVARHAAVRRRGPGRCAARRRLAARRRHRPRLHALHPDPAAAAGGRRLAGRDLDAAQRDRSDAERVPEGRAARAGRLTPPIPTGRHHRASGPVTQDHGASRGPARAGPLANGCA